MDIILLALLVSGCGILSRGSQKMIAIREREPGERITDHAYRGRAERRRREKGSAWVQACAGLALIVAGFVRHMLLLR